MMEAHGRRMQVSEHRKAWGMVDDAPAVEVATDEDEEDRVLETGRNLRMALRFSPIHELLLLLASKSSSAGLVSSTSVLCG
jgi:hypothetical protein